MPTLDTLDRNTLSQALGEATNSSTNMRLNHRLHAVLLIAQGCRINEVARWFDDNPSTVARWVRHFSAFGVLGLRDDHKTGRPTKLDADALLRLAQELDQQPTTLGYPFNQWSGKRLASHLESCYSVTIGVRQCQRLLQQLHPPKESKPVKDSRV